MWFAEEQLVKMRTTTGIELDCTSITTVAGFGFRFHFCVAVDGG